MNRKHLLLSLSLLFVAAVGAEAQEKKLSVASDIKLSGYIITQYQYSDQEGSGSNSFDIRMARLALEGRLVSDFYWKAQIQFNGNTSKLGSSPRVVDAFVEWQKYKPAMIKIGQFKRPFTFENPIHPLTQGFMGYSQNVSKLSGFSDRTGEHSSNGRDIGIQLQGDLFKNASGRYLVHYQVGVFNGQGINTKDVDERKDIIGGAWVMPVAGMRIGLFGWTGSYARNGSWTETAADGTEVTKSGTRSLDRNRYAISFDYNLNDWTFRSEYIHSQGYGFKTTYQDVDDAADCTINTAAGDKADGYYALVIAPIIEEKVHVKARYDLYRPRAEWGTAKTYYEVGADYSPIKNVKISAEYAYVYDRSLADPSYNMIDVQVAVKF